MPRHATMRRFQELAALAGRLEMLRWELELRRGITVGQERFTAVSRKLRRAQDLRELVEERLTRMVAYGTCG